MFSLKKIQQRSRRSRRVATDRRSAVPAAPASSILRKHDCLRNNSRRITFSTTCTAMPFIKDVPPKNLLSGFPEVEQQITSRREVAAPSILRSGDCQRNKSRRVSISTTCTAMPFDKQEPPKDLMAGFPEVEQLIPRVEVVEERPQKEEDAVSFGRDADAEPIEQRKRRGGLRREVASLTGQLGEYWTVDTSAKRVRRKPDRFIP